MQSGSNPDRLQLGNLDYANRAILSRRLHCKKLAYLRICCNGACVESLQVISLKQEAGCEVCYA